MTVLEEERLVILSGARPGAVQVCTGFNLPVASAGHLACSFLASSAQAPMVLLLIMLKSHVSALGV